MLMTILDLSINICQLRQSAQFVNAQFDLKRLRLKSMHNTEQSDEISPSVTFCIKWATTGC